MPLFEDAPRSLREAYQISTTMVDRLGDGSGWVPMVEVADRSLAERGSRLTMTLAWMVGRLAMDLATVNAGDAKDVLRVLVERSLPDEE
jgi:hypothetical protein